MSQLRLQKRLLLQELLLRPARICGPGQLLQLRRTSQLLLLLDKLYLLRLLLVLLRLRLRTIYAGHRRGLLHGAGD